MPRLAVLLFIAGACAAQAGCGPQPARASFYSFWSGDIAHYPPWQHEPQKLPPGTAGSTDDATWVHIGRQTVGGNLPGAPGAHAWKEFECSDEVQANDWCTVDFYVRFAQQGNDRLVVTMTGATGQQNVGYMPQAVGVPPAVGAGWQVNYSFRMSVRGCGPNCRVDFRIDGQPNAPVQSWADVSLARRRCHGGADETNRPQSIYKGTLYDREGNPLNPQKP